MPTQIEYALFAANVYGSKDRDYQGVQADIRHRNNTLPVPDGWNKLGDPVITTGLPGGFMAQAYRRGNEIVISYAGTTDFQDWITGNVPAATAATLAPQVLDAAKFYLDVKAANPGAQITFTGHSLGGGLASLMAVYFNRPATVFDQAPFQKSADSLAIVDALRNKLVLAGYTVPPELQSYVAYDQTGAFIPSPTRIARDDQVDHIFVTGEALSILSTTLTNFLAIALGRLNVRLGIVGFGVDKIQDGTVVELNPGAQTILGWGASLNGVAITNGDPVSLHSISLLTGFLQTPGFLTLVQNYPELVPRMLAGMFKNEPTLEDANLLDLFVQREYRGEGVMSALIADVSKIDRSNGLTLLRDVPVGNSANGDADYVAAIAIDAVLAGLYNQGKARQPGTPYVATFEQVLEQVQGGVRFDISRFSEDARSLDTSLDHLVTLLLGEEANAANYTKDARWTLQSGTAALNVTQPNDGKTDVMVGFDQGDSLAGGDGDDQLIGLGGSDTLKGGSGIDALVGGDGNDLLEGGIGTDYLYGSAGDDTLEGGMNGDWLTGGAGTDTYRFTDAFGGDWIIDSDGNGRIEVDANVVDGADAKKFDATHNVWSTDEWVFTQVDNGSGGTDLILQRDSSLNQIRIRNWVSGQLGITLGTEVATPVATMTLTGDFVKKTETDANGTRYVSSPTGYVNDGEQADAPDVINGGSNAEIIRGLGGNDGLSGGGGDDSIEGGEGNDLVYGGDGRDTLIGGSGNDVIGGSYGQWIFTPSDDEFQFNALPSGHEEFARGFSWVESRLPATQATWATAINFAVGAGTRGDGFDYSDGGNVIDAGDGDDMVWAGWGADVVYAGAGNDSVRGVDFADVIYGQDGDDLLLGDGYGNLDASIIGYSPPENHGDDVIDGGTGNDTIQGQLGNDALYGGADNDAIWGDAGDQIVPGPNGTLHGQDMLSGGSGNDALYGDGGSDELFGDDGNDTLLGDLDGLAVPGSADYVATQFQGADYLDGGAGTDLLLGHGGNDDLFGGIGNDTLRGDAGQDQLEGAAHGDDYLAGEEGDDRLWGEGGNDQLFGGVGNDTMVGDADTAARGVGGEFHGHDYLDGEDGDDFLLGSGGGDELFGGEGTDTLLGDAGVSEVEGRFHGDDYLDGEAANDLVIGDGGNDTLFGGAGDDELQGDVASLEEAGLDGQYHGSDVLDGEEGNDLLFGGGAGDRLLGGLGNDTLRGDVSLEVAAAQFHGDDQLDGGQGDDVLFGDNGDDTLVGGDGDDWLAGEDELNGTVVSALAGDDRLDGGSGTDTLIGGNGTDELDGGEGLDILIGGAGNDVLISDGQDYLAGGSGDDTYMVTTRAADPATGQLLATMIHDTQGISVLQVDGVPSEQLHVVNLGGQVIVSAGAAGAVALSQGTALDTVRIVSDVGGGAELTARELVQRDDANGLMQSVRLAADGQLLTTASATEAQSLKGTSVADLLEGGTAGDDVDGGDGDDMLRGNAGRDVIRGGLGSDTLQGGAGNDNLFGGKEGASDASTDTFVFNLGDGNDTVEFGLGGQGILRFGAGVTRESLIVTNLGGATASTRLLKIEYSPTDSIIIEAGSDARLASIEFADGSSISRADLLGVTPAYTAGDDFLSGAAGADLLDGGAGNDTLNGLGGSDTLTGGEGNDVLNGGTGNNTYLFAPGSGTDEIVPTTDESATLRFADVDYPQMRASLQGSDLWLVQPGGERVKVTGYADAPDLAQWNVVARDGSVHTLADLLAASEAAHALSARRDAFLAEQRLRLGSKIVEQNIDPAAPAATYRHFRTEGSVSIDTVTYQRVPQYEQTTTTRLNIPAGYEAILQGSADPANGGDGSYDVPGMFVETTTSNRLVGWNYVPSTTTTTVVTATNSQFIVTGSAGNDRLTPDNSTRPDGHALFRGRVDMGDGDDVVNLNGQSPSWYQQRYNGLGAWIELGAGNDSVVGTDVDDVIIGGTGSDTLHGHAGSDTYLVAADGSGVDAIHDDLDWLAVDWGAGVDRSGWDFNDELEVDYAGGAGLDRVEFDSTVQRSLLSQRFAGNTLQLLHDETLFLEIDYRPESLAAHLSGAASGAMPGVESFRFSDGTVISLRELVATTPIAAPDALRGSDGDDLLIGTAGDDLMLGLAGNDTLKGGAGTDAMQGGAGNDIYVVDSTADVVSENADEGIDLVRSTVSYALGDNVENLTLLGTDSVSGSGNALDNTLIGNGGSNVLGGGGGNDTLNGGEGGDTLQGGAGDDVYTVDAAGDVVIESLDEGIDLVRSTVSYALGDNIENLTLIGTEGLSGSGNALDNTLIGNEANNALSGGGGNDLLNGGAGADTMQGGTGNDIYVVDSAADMVIENNGEGTDLVRATVSCVLGNNLENLTLFGTGGLSGSGNALDNTLIGNDGGNALAGGDGHDTLNGGAGSDTLQGGVGDDTYTVDHAGDVVIESVDQGIDLVRASIAYTLGANAENLTLIGTQAIAGSGNALDNTLVGNDADNFLSGGAGNDVLNGGAGADSMQGSTGNDVYVVDSTSDAVSENVGEGADLVRSTVSYVLASNVENLTLIGSDSLRGSGNALDNTLIGNGGSSVLSGDAGNDTINGAAGDDILDGGSGNDSMRGGVGNDIYVVDSATDAVVENTSEGTDSVSSGVTWTLGANVENLTLTTSAHINGTGNAAANVITGNAGNNVLNGGAGADTLIGGAGNDTYTVDNAADVLIEQAGEGTDGVSSGVSFALAANIENLTLTGTAVINGTGNTLDNVLTGNTANNTLTGGAGNDTIDGGTGNDTMVGGAGNDTYTVNVATDAVTELAGEGIDTVRSAVTLTLTSANLENLTLTGTTAINGTGNAEGNVLIGNTANNRLVGNAGNDTLDGGTGNDTMEGGAGDDTYVVNVTTDVVTELASAGTDTVQSSVTLTLTSTNLENLTLLGTGAINGTGNANANVLIGNTGVNTLSGLAGNDTYDGAAGNDNLTDNSTTSNDVYRWGIGQGNDRITDAGGSDRIEIGAGVVAGQVSLVRNASNLEVRISGATDVLTVVNWYTATANRIEEIRLADGTVINAGTAAPLSASGPTELSQMRRVGGQAVAGTTAIDAASIDGDRNWRLLIQAMAQFDGRSALGDAVERARRPDHLRIDLASPL